MKINSLRIKNFRSYRGLTEFDFKVNGDKNIILIGGENGAGKSSIFEAIKICLYGPLTYKYKGMVTAYISRVKSMINEDAYFDEFVESYIELDLDMNSYDRGGDYKIKRKWIFEDTKLVEEFIVYENGTELDGDDTINFMEYFKSIIPPSVFDLSFFDGEKLFDFFDEKLSGDRLSETILVLNNLDVFGILNKELMLNARRKNREKKNLREESLEFENIEKDFLDMTAELDSILSLIDEELEQIDKLSIEINKMKKDFILAGGLDSKKREEIMSEISKYELERDRVNMELKKFYNDSLPFLILKDELKKIKNNIFLEEEFFIYDTVKSRIDRIDFNSLLKSKLRDEIDIDELIYDIKNQMIPRKFNEKFTPVHCLSREQANKVLSKIDEIIDIDIDEIDFFRRIDYYTNKIAENREILRSAMSIEEEEMYIYNINNLRDELNIRGLRLETLKKEKENLEKEIDLKHKKMIRLSEKIDLIKKADNIKYISDDIIKATDELVRRITFNKRIEISNYFNEIFSRIMRKDKFIDYIYIDEDFNVNLYKKKTYVKQELIYMVANLGVSELRNKLGDKFIIELIGKKDVTKSELLEGLNSFYLEEKIDLSTKIDLMKLSSGEKQIYILCLYWALIKSSKVNIPFVIDTPYGRIDKMHRSAITNKYLPNISEQVIVLSTNTEIEESLYSDMSKYVSKEYILDYDVDSRSTKVDSGYFYEVI